MTVIYSEWSTPLFFWLFNSFCCKTMLLLAASHFRLWANTEYFSKTGREGITSREKRKKSFFKALSPLAFHQTFPLSAWVPASLSNTCGLSCYLVLVHHWSSPPASLSQYVYPCWSFDLKLNYTQFTILFRTHVVLPCPHKSLALSTALANLSQYVYPSWILDFNSSQFTENSVKDEAGSCKEGNTVLLVSRWIPPRVPYVTTSLCARPSSSSTSWSWWSSSS